MRDPGYFDYLPYKNRPVIRWPNGARMAFWVAPNIEFYELNPPRNPTRAPLAAARARYPELFLSRLRQSCGLLAYAGVDERLRYAR